MGCASCGRGFHSECVDCEECHGDIEQKAATLRTIGNGVGQPVKDPKNVKDRHSTGRKRAAQIYPIFENSPCEWQGKKNCGGGTPIVGCISGLQVDRHHGPVKDTLRNEPTNVHRICKPCHNRWHAVNDPIYNEALYNTLPHQPEPADEMELLAAEAYWRIKK